MFYAAARRRSLLTCSRRFSIRPQASAHLLLVRSSCVTCCCIVVCFASVHSELVAVSPSRVVDCHADLLRHPWTVGLGDPAEFDQLISQMDTAQFPRFVTVSVRLRDRHKARTTFGAEGTLIVHDTIQEVGVSPAQYRPFIHAYSTATLMGEGESSTGVGQDWSWPRYCTSQSRKSNAFGAIKGTAWSGPGISPPAAPVNQDLVSLVYNGRDRPGQAGFSTVYLKALRTLESLWHSHGRLQGRFTISTIYLRRKTAPAY